MRIGFLGGGMMAQVGHLPFYVEDPRCTVVAACESRPSLVATLRERFRIPRIVDRHEELLSDPDIDAVVVSAPREATGPLVLDALNAGKAVLSEKPMAHTWEQGSRLVDAAKTAGVLYAVGFMKRYDPGVQTARAAFEELKRDGSLGRWLGARFFDFSAEYAVAPPPHVRPAESREIRFPTWPTAPDWLSPERRGSYAWFMNAISHDVNLLRFFLGDDLTTSHAVQPNESSLIAQFLQDDAVIVLEAAKVAAGRWIEGAEFWFERGRLCVDIPSPMATTEVARVTIDRRAPAPRSEELTVPQGWSFARQAQAFIAALTEGTSLATSGSDCLNDLAMAEAIWRSVEGRPEKT